MTLLQVDLSQAELRVMAILSGDQWMINALQEGAGDFFDTYMMPVCFPHEDMVALKADPVRKKELRTQVKTVQYGLAFGRQAPAIAVELGMSVSDAQKIINNYFKSAFKFYQWRLEVMDAAVNLHRRDLLVTPFGRRFQSEVITRRNENNIQREALSFLPQSIASDICLTTAIMSHEVIKTEFRSHIVALVHDAIIVECPDNETARKVGMYLQAQFRRVGATFMGNEVPFLSEMTIDKNWGAML